MKVAIIGSRYLRVDNLQEYLPVETTEIVSGGARGTFLVKYLYQQKRRVFNTSFEY